MKIRFVHLYCYFFKTYYGIHEDIEKCKIFPGIYVDTNVFVESKWPLKSCDILTFKISCVRI